jgi:hypothetical protein
MAEKGDAEKIALALEHYHGKKADMLIDLGIKYKLTIEVDGETVVDKGVAAHISSHRHHHSKHAKKHHEDETPHSSSSSSSSLPKVYTFSDSEDLDNSFEKQLHALYAAENPDKDDHKSLKHYKGDKHKLLVDLGVKYKVTVLYNEETLVLAGVAEEPKKEYKRKVIRKKVEEEEEEDDDDADGLDMYSMDVPKIEGIDKGYSQKTKTKHHSVRSSVDEAYLGGKPTVDHNSDNQWLELREIKDEDSLGQDRGKKMERMEGRQGSGAVNVMGQHYVLAGHKHTDEQGHLITKERDGRQIDSTKWRDEDDHVGVQVERPVNEVALIFFLTLPCTLVYLCFCVEPCKLCQPKDKVGPSIPVPK